MTHRLIHKLTAVFTCVTLLAIIVSSCKKYLDTSPQGQVTAADIATDPNAATDLVNGVYNSLYLGDPFGTDVHSLSYVIMTNVASDDADKGSSPNDYSPALEIDSFIVGPSNGIVNNIWKGYYQAIARANQALTALPATSADPNFTKLIGEVKFIRAYLYFNMVRFFGGVPKLDKVPLAAEANNPALQTRASKDSIYQFIIDDLQYAVNNVPDKNNTQVGRVTRAAAQSLLAKVYLYQKKWQQVYDLTTAVTQSGLYSLLPQYENIWRQVGANGSESIFEVQTGINADCNAAIDRYVVSQGPRAGGKFGWSDLGYGFDTPSQNLVDAYEPNDKRKAGTIIIINKNPGGTVLWDGFRIPSKDSVENNYYNYKAYHSRTAEAECSNMNTDRLPKNLRILRYGDVLLMNAEASNELGKTAEALVSLNKIRQRAGLMPVAGLSGTPLRDTIWHERRVELAMEHDRFFDIVRQGRAGQILRALGKKFVDGKNEVFPIPQDQIALSSGKLLQNPGY